MTRLFPLCIIVIFQLSINAQFFNFDGEYSLGLGNLTKHVGKIQTDIDGGRNYATFNPFLRGNYRTDFFWGKKINIEASVTIPKSTSDGIVTETNLWIQTLIEHSINEQFRISAGLGLFFTYLLMDGTTQTLGNGTSTQEFVTPDDFQTAINNIVIIGGDYIINKEFYFNTQFSIFNIEDSEERSFSYALSLNYLFGNSQ